MFRDHVFVLAIDGSLVAHENFQNVLLDIAVLRSLNIKVVLVHGVGQQIEVLAKQKETAISDPQTDAVTLELATEAAAMVSLKVMQGLTRNGLRCATCNGVRSKEIGIFKGKDQLSSGAVDKIDEVLFNKLLDADTIPVITPIAFNRDGAPLRINSDLLASELASKLKASKLIYMTTQEGLQISGQPLTNLPVADLEGLIETHQTNARSLTQQVQARGQSNQCRYAPRAHSRRASLRRAAQRNFR
jgi:amino-acid N-acetyltransferase